MARIYLRISTFSFVSFFKTIPIVLFAFTMSAQQAGQEQPISNANAVAPGSSIVTFLPVVTYDTGGTGAGSLVAADLNGDGKVDLVVGVGGDTGIGIMLGNGDGTFQPIVRYSTAEVIPSGLAVADVNNDGIVDILVSGPVFGGSDNGAVGVLLGNGNGTFQTPVSYASGGTFPYSIAVADFNGDGKPDLVVTDCSPVTGTPCGLFGILLGNGNGTFKPVVTYNSGGVGAWAVAVSDVNGDGKADLVIGNLCTVVSCKGDGVVAVLLGNGDGTFKAPVTYDSGGRTLMPVVADVNGDNKPDILILNGSGREGLGVLLGNGDGTFQPVVTFNLGEKFASNLTVGDFNGDGKLDVAISDCNFGQYTCSANASVSVLLGNGDGTFRTPVAFSSGGWFSMGVAAADVNKDGKLDLLVANCAPLGGTCDGTKPGVVGVLLNSTPSGKIATSVKLKSSFNPSLVGQAVTFTATVISSAGTPPDGEVITFRNGSAVLGTASLNGSRAALTTSSLPVGVFTITADYSGDADFVSSTSNALQQTVNSTTRFATSTNLVSNLNPAVYGQSITFTASVTSASATMPSGKISFVWSGHMIGSATLNAGIAILTLRTLNAGSYPLTAVYNGDPNNLGSTSVVVNQVVKQTSSSANIKSSNNPSSAGQAVTFTVRISSPTVTPKGPVIFSAGKITLGTAQLSSGKATLTTSVLPVGSTQVTVTYNGNSNIGKSSASLTQTVQP